MHFIQPLTNAVSLEQVLLLKQSSSDELICELQSLSNLTQGKFAVAIGASYVTVSGWTVGEIQLAELALCQRQVQALAKRLIQFTLQPIQDRGKEILALYFGKMQG